MQRMGGVIWWRMDMSEGDGLDPSVGKEYLFTVRMQCTTKELELE
jgi:hypothetical protein